jgi:apolipoprotein N-acyltransferase
VLRRLLRAWPFAAAAAAGASIFLAGPDFDLWWLAWLSLLPLLLALRGATPRRAAAIGFCAGLFCNAGGFYWVVGLLARFGHLPVAVGVPIWLLLSSYQAVVFAAWAWIVVRLAGRPAIVVAPLAMVSLERVVPFMFPWYMAVTQAWQAEVIQIAEVTGSLGVTFLLAMTAGAAFDAVERRRSGAPGAAWPPLVAIGVVAAVIAGGRLRMGQIDARRAAAPKLRVGLVQGNVGIVEKSDPALDAAHLALHQTWTRDLERRGAELVVWPESAYPYTLRRPVERDWPERDRRRVMRGIGVPVLFGAVTRERAGGAYNSAVLMEPDGRVTGFYDKNYLLLFGEYVPLYDELNVERWLPAASNFRRGTTVATMPLGGHRLGPLICYEDILPAFCRTLAALRPNLLVNVTNDAWFGKTSEPHQHLALSVFRAVETRLDLVRAVNTGVSAFVDAAGRVRERGPLVDPSREPAEPFTFLADTALLETHTFYARFGDVFGWACLAALASLLWRSRRGRPVGGGAPRAGRKW